MTYYKDFDLNFGMNPFSKDVLTKVDVNSVRQALKVLVLTNPGEKPFAPEYGCGIAGLLFENFGFATKIHIESRIKEQVFTYEPRVKLESVEIDDSRIDANEININISFYVVGNDSLESLNISFERIK